VRTRKEIDAQVEAIVLRLRGARWAADRSQAECAEAVGLQRPAYTMIEQGRQKITVAQIIGLACFLTVPLDWLMAEDLYRIPTARWNPPFWISFMQKIAAEERSKRRIGVK